MSNIEISLRTSDVSITIKTSLIVVNGKQLLFRSEFMLIN